MLRLVQIFVLQYSLISLTSAQNFRVPSCNGQRDGVTFPDPTSCENFFRCRGGGLHRLNCPEGTLFDLNLYYCVSEVVVDCLDRARSQENIERNRPPTRESHHAICQNVRDGTLMANPRNCRAFIECQTNLRLDDECSSTEFFDTRSNRCRPASTVSCGDREILQPNSEIIARQACRGAENSVRVIDPSGCEKYYECFFQNTIPRTCRNGHLFDEIIRSCVPANLAKCGNRQRDTSTHGISQLQFICHDLPSGTRLSDPYDCQRYYECRNNEKFDLICPPNQLFDLKSSQCRPSRLVTCGSREGVNVGRRDVCIGQRNGRLMADPHNCRAYFECQSERGIERTCSSGYLFDTDTSSCNEAFAVRCGSRIIPPEDSLLNPEDFFPECPARGTIFRPNPQDCNGYIICAEGQLIQNFCDPGLHFNPRINACDTPANSNCMVSRVVPQTPLMPDCLPGERFFPHLGNCQQYYVCESMKATLMTCPINQMWDNSAERCVRLNPNLCRRNYLLSDY